MEYKIHTFKYGINSVYLIKQAGMIMVDAGPPNIGKRFSKDLTANDLDPAEIKLIILTHGDFDHAGSAAQLKKLTGANLAIHQGDKDTYLRQ